MAGNLNNLDVAAVSGADRYPVRAPFDPPEIYPEYPHSERRTDPSNGVYGMVREALRLLGLDAARFGTPEWDPLGELIEPGERVLIKPNLVLHFNAGGGPLEAVVTHPSVARAVADYVAIALRGEGRIRIGDAPQANCDFGVLASSLGLDATAEFLRHACGRRGIEVEVLDFRTEQAFYRHGIIWRRKPLGGSEPVPVRLGRESLMDAIDPERLYGADYCRRITAEAHRNHRHEYLVAPAVLESDVVVSVPKLKVHRKVGTTLNIKNMVGINTDKNHLAHYRVGPPADGGDEFSNPRWEDRAERFLSDRLLGANWRAGRYPFLAWRAFRKGVRIARGGSAVPAFTHGNWRGNDTAWRMALDLNRVLLCADREGRIHPAAARRYFSIIDGVVGGEGEGPLHPDAYPSGVVLAGFNPLAVDWAATWLMGFDPERIAMYANGVAQMREWVPDFSPGAVEIRSNIPDWNGPPVGGKTVFEFRPAAGWRGAIERYEMQNAECGMRNAE